jgi:polar amino acid transport system permease protein
MAASFAAELVANSGQLALGLAQTLFVTVASTVLGTALGIPLGVWMFRGGHIARFLLSLYVDIIRGTPVLVLILASYYIIPMLGLNLSAVAAGVIAIGLFCSAQVGEITRGSLKAIDRGQSEAAMSIGLLQHQILIDILFPQALGMALPAWMNTVIETVKGSSLLLIIGVAELMLTTQQITSRTHMIAEFLGVAGVLYFCVNYSLERLSGYLEKRVFFGK